MAHIVYHTCWDNILGMGLESLKDHFVDGVFAGADFQKNDFRYCPAFNDYLKNTFVVKSHFQYELQWDGNTFSSPMYDQKFFDSYIFARSLKTGMFTYRSPSPLFITESDSLMMSQEPPSLHDNDINKNLYVIPGKFDIGKHFPRPVELAGKFKQPGTIKINEGDGLYYVRFHTNEKIIFKEFVFTIELKDLISQNLEIRSHNKGLKPLRWWYDYVAKHNLKKYIIKEIKKNLL